jgi:DNA processing protein
MTVTTSLTRQLLTLSMLPGVGPATLRKIAALKDFERLDIEKLSAQFPALLKATKDPSAWELAQENAEKQIEQARKSEARILSPKDPEYPRLLASTKDDPFLLYVRGSLARYPERSVAVIGTREPTQHGQLIAGRITQFFAEHQWSVVSGLAIGCDAIAHQSAIDVGGHTVAVLAHGLQTIAPARHRKLADDILLSGGALVSEYPFGRDVQKQQYVKRDRTQAGLAQGVVMIQSDLVGGSLHASRAALDYDRWLAVPYPTPKDRERGESKVQANLLIAQGTDAQRTELLRCPQSALKRVIVLRSKEDYLDMMALPEGERLNEFRMYSANKGSAGEIPVVPCAPGITGKTTSDALYADIQRNAPADRHIEADEAGRSQASREDAGAIHHALEDQASLFSDPSGTEMKWTDAPADAKHHLKIVPMPGSNETKSTTAKILIEHTPLNLALTALLGYLQVRLDAVEVAHQQLTCSDSTGDRQYFQFTIDDALSHMERAAELLLAIESAQSTDMAEAQNLSNEAVSGWTRRIGFLTDARRDELRQRERAFFSTLHHLQNTSLSRLLVASSDFPEATIAGYHDGVTAALSVWRADQRSDDAPATNVYIEDLVKNFNRLVRKALYA